MARTTIFCLHCGKPGSDLLCEACHALMELRLGDPQLRRRLEMLYAAARQRQYNAPDLVGEEWTIEPMRKET